MITHVVDWFSGLTTAQQALVVTATGVFLAGVGLVCQRWDRWRDRRAARKKAATEAQEKLEAKQQAAEQRAEQKKREAEQRAAARPQPEWKLIHDEKCVWFLALSGADAYDVEIWSTPPDQVTDFGAAEDIRGTLKIKHYPVGRRMSLFIFPGTLGSPSIRVHLSWKRSPESDERKQIDIY